MPLSHLRRPLVLAALLWGAALAWRRTPAPELLWPPSRFGVHLEGRISSPLKEHLREDRVFVDAEHLDGRPFPQKVLLRLRAGGHDWLRPGLAVTAEGKLRRPRAPRNPGEFDERGFLEQKGASWILHAVSLSSSAAAPVWEPRAWAEAARRSFESSLERQLPAAQARLAAGLSLGYKGALPADLDRASRDSGTIHLLVPSGAKVALVLLGLARLGSLLTLPPWARFIAAALAGGFYTLMVGAEAPYARAYLGALVLLLGPLLGRDSGPMQAAAVSALLLLVEDPREIGGAGFQMTYAATVALGLGLPRWRKMLPRGKLWEAAAVCLLVQVSLWPIFVQVFGRASLIGPLANFVLVPVAAPLAAGAWILWAWPDPMIASVLGQALSWFGRAMVFFAQVPYAAVDIAPMTTWQLWAYCAAAAAVCLWPQRPARWSLLCLAGLLWGGGNLLAAARAPALEVTFLSLKRGRPALLTFAGGRHWLVDPVGPAGGVEDALRALRVDKLEALVLAGAHEERAAKALIERLKPERVLRTRPFSLCMRPVCLDLGTPWPRLRRGEGEYSIIATRLKTAALVIEADGSAVRLHPFKPI